MRVVWCLLFASLLGVSFGGCSSVSCDEAISKLETCLKQIDCRDADPLERSKCDKAKSSGDKALADLKSLPCVAQVKDTAKQVNACPTLNPVSFCNPCLSN